MDVALIRWPEEGPRRVQLARRDLPRLLLLDVEVEAPICHDPLEDWVRVPAPAPDVRAREESLMRRFEERRASTPELNENGVLRFRNVSVELTPLQARLIARLLTELGAVVSRSELLAAGWGDEEVSPNSLEAQLTRIRKRIEHMDISIRTVRSRGYVLETVAQRD